ncbi:GNAT family N-acetyltransferase [Leclercia adecarboxylata]|uniref:GNAT family N-acetyltransferase n=1 Tax=Leclercia adecarboxylata TaxID=83655 RepID=UPI001F055805|nr:GNAT family N-acetyltransferase [Leclercia adecarboxylata]MCH2683552.1 GNAT family N-acetyltransferase [Leclercia adecarboxylata]
MPDMVDPSDSLINFQDALTNKLITLSSCVVHPEMKRFFDDPEGTPRITFALLDGVNVKGIAIYHPTEPINGMACFSLGYAVAEQFRKQGVATEIVQKSLDEIHAGFRKNMPKFYVEAIVGVDNHGSNKVASRIISEKPIACDETYLGRPAQKYLRFLE